jgi:predicted nucleotidyltransferase
MLRVKPDRPLSPVLLALIRTLDRVAAESGIAYFVIGATARDILMEHVYALETVRATHDIDFAVAVPSWAGFAELKARLIATGEFLPGDQVQRLMFGDYAAAYPLDLVPFDGVERDGAIAWPPDGDFVMNIAGYADARDSALAVEIAPGFAISIVSLPAMAVLKVLAWNDRPDRDKHASDVLFILRHYHEAGQFDRLYDDGADLMAAYDYDIELAGAGLLGRDARRDVSGDTCQQALDALSGEHRIDKFIVQAMRSSTVPVERAAAILAAFMQALRA